MLILRKEAEEDIAHAYRWYESQRENLGGAFVAEVGRSFELIEENPESFRLFMNQFAGHSARNSPTQSILSSGNRR
jgi:hypothetical protein